ncbi:hypothetical protein PMAYCL1PPCAC_16745, partial [Pristionchus mayeri]
GLNLFLMFTINCFALAMSIQVIVSSFFTQLATTTDNRQFALVITTLSISISIILAVLHIPGSAAYAQAVMVTLTALILLCLLNMNHRWRKTRLSDELRAKSRFEENMRCVRLVF